MAKCLSELLAIFLYVGMIMMLAVGLRQQISMGKPMTAFFELAMCILVDQVKSLPAQFVLWWVVIRRLGKLEPADFTEWDDQEIWEGGVQMSLYELIRFKIRTFLENKYIYGLILGMTLFLCVVILSELSIPD